MGLTAGRSDMVLYYNKTAYMIEVKTATGTQKENQKEWQKLIEKQGFNYYIVRNLEGFSELLKKIIQ